MVSVLKEIKMKRLYIYFCIFIAVFFMFTSCDQPNPLYGTWADNHAPQSNQIVIIPDGSCLIRVEGYSVGSVDTVSGTYKITENIISFRMPNAVVVSEYDIRGNELTLTWTYPDRTTRKFILYKIRN